MENVDYLIIGGGISGTSAAETIRQEDQNSKIVILEDEKYPLYSRVQIPYYLRNVKTREQIFLRDFESYKTKNIEYLTQKFVVSLNLSESIVKTSDGESYNFKKLLLTTGGSPKKLNKYPNEHSMQTIEDADRIYEDIKKAKKGIIIGSGFIALEFLETFLYHKLDTSLCVNKDGFWANFLSKEVSNCILSVISKRGVKVYYGDVPEIPDSPDVIVGTGIGIDVSRDFIKSSGLKFDMGIVADSKLKTSADNVYAAGDVVKFFSTKLDRYVKYGNWTNAAISGKYAGFNLLGKDLAYDNLSAYSIKPEGLSIVFLGFAGTDENTVTKTKVYSETECAQFFIRNGKLDGCILINKSIERSTYQRIIESREDFKVD